MPTPRLKYFLQQANILLSSLYSPPPCAFAFIKGRTIVGNASVHIHKKYILSIDLKDFFNSISIQQATYAIKSAFPWQLRNDLISIIVESSSLKGHLVQGSPLSPVISNIVCINLDKRISAYCKEQNISYTRYADDFTFSSNVYDFKKDTSFYDHIREVITSEGFILNDGKTHVQLYDNRQIVTGLIVNAKVNVSKQYVKDLRNLLYIWDNYGYDIATERFRFHYLHISRKIKVAENHFLSYRDKQNILRSRLKKNAKRYSPRLDQYIRGRLNFLKMVKGENDNQYKRLAEKFNHLSAGLSYNRKETEINFQTIDDFERKLSIHLITDTIPYLVSDATSINYLRTNNSGKVVLSPNVLNFLASLEQDYLPVAVSLFKSCCRIKITNLEANQFLIWATKFDLRQYHWKIVDSVHKSARDKYLSIDSIADMPRLELEILHNDFQFAMKYGNYSMIDADVHICEYLGINPGLVAENFELLTSAEKSVLLHKWGWYLHILGIDVVPTERTGEPLFESVYSTYRKEWNKNFANTNWNKAEGIALVIGNNKWIIEINKGNTNDILKRLSKHKATKVILFNSQTPLILIEKDLLPDKKYRSFKLHKSGYFPIKPHQGEIMEVITLT